MLLTISLEKGIFANACAKSHIKDYREVGQSGMVGFDAIFNNFGIAGTKYFVVEMESSSYGDIFRSCRESIDYLKAVKIVKASY